MPSFELRGHAQGGVPLLQRLVRNRPRLDRPGQPSRRRDHFVDTPSPSLLKHLLKVEGGAAE